MLIVLTEWHCTGMSARTWALDVTPPFQTWNPRSCLWTVMETKTTSSNALSTPTGTIGAKPIRKTSASSAGTVSFQHCMRNRPLDELVDMMESFKPGQEMAPPVCNYVNIFPGYNIFNMAP